VHSHLVAGETGRPKRSSRFRDLRRRMTYRERENAHGACVTSCIRRRFIHIAENGPSTTSD
jgi:hypothetical protein